MGQPPSPPFEKSLHFDFFGPFPYSVTSCMGGCMTMACLSGKGHGKHLHWISCTLRSGLHEILTMIRTFPHELENNHACKWTSDNFPGKLTYVLFLVSCQKTICMHGYSPIHVDRSLRVSNLWDKYVPYF